MHYDDRPVVQFDPNNEMPVGDLFRHRFLWRPLDASNSLKSALASLEALRSIASTRMSHEIRLFSELTAVLETRSTKLLNDLYDTRFHLSHQFSDDVREEIVVPIDDFISRHRSVNESLHKDAQVLIEALGERSSELRSTRALIEQISSRLRKAIDELNQGESSTVDYTAGYVQISRLGFDLRNACEAEEILKRSHSEFVKLSYIPSMSTILNMFEDLFKSTNELYDECYKKLIVFEVSLNRGIQYELTKVATDLESHNPMISVPAKDADAKSQTSEFSAPIEDILTTPTIPIHFPISIQTYPKASSPVLSIIDNTFSLMSGEIDTNSLETIRCSLSSHSCRHTVIRYIQSQTTLVSNPVSLRNLGRIVWVILDECMQEPLDVLIARSFLPMAKSISFFDSSIGRKKFLQSEIYDHKIWSMNAFWHNAVTITVAEHIWNHGLGNTTDQSDFPSISLNDFGTYMLMFGLSYDSSLRIFRRVFDESFSWLPENDQTKLIMMKGLDDAAERQLRNSTVPTGS